MHFGRLSAQCCLHCVWCCPQEMLPKSRCTAVLSGVVQLHFHHHACNAPIQWNNLASSPNMTMKVHWAARKCHLGRKACSYQNAARRQWCQKRFSCPLKAIHHSSINNLKCGSNLINEWLILFIIMLIKNCLPLPSVHVRCSLISACWQTILSFYVASASETTSTEVVSCGSVQFCSTEVLLYTAVAMRFTEAY